MSNVKHLAGLTLLLLLPAALTACPAPPQGEGEGEGPSEGEGGEGEGGEGEGAGEGEGEGDGFNDHTVARLATLADFEAFAAPSASSTAVKFVITRFLKPGQNLRFLASDHYGLHDEWYWFRLMNGARVDGVDDIAPVDVGRSLDTVHDIVDWAHTQQALPLDLTFVNDGRLYSPHFYDLSLFNEPKTLGIGTVLHFAARAPIPETWAVELEYQHVLSAAELVQMFAMLAPTLPADVGASLKILVRSPQHEELLQQLIAAGDPLAARFIHYSDVTVPGQTEVYSEGLVAGRLRVIHSGDNFQDSRSTDILVSEDLVDFLPQCAGLVTAVPQTALAHINLLAKNRGIPNAFRSGILDDPNLDQLSRVRAPVIVKATGVDQLQLVAMTETQFAQFRALNLVPPSSAPPVDVSTIEYAYDLTTPSFTDEATLRPMLGGKASGYLALLDQSPDIETPDTPFAVSVRGYVEHLADLKPMIQQVLANPQFQADANVRVLGLEGIGGWNTRHPELPAFPGDFLATRPSGDVLRTVIESGGISGLVTSKPMDPVALAAITAMAEDHFGSYADVQGLRFRSSSNVEDAEGFNGAGLYTSNTGYLHADRLTGSNAHKTIEHAVKTTWASYWDVEGFEERRLANVDHLSGAMGCAVHANFQNDKEIGNGVMTYTILPPGHPDGAAILEINAQEGSLSVTNPPAGDPNLPEVDRVVLHDDGTTALTRVRGSTVLAPGSFVVDDAQIARLFDETRRVSEYWKDVDNSALPLSQQRQEITINFEFREVAPGWPVLADGTQRPTRVVIKQARTLEPSTVRVPSAVKSLPIPKDILSRARRVVQRTCTAGALNVVITDAFTDALKPPDLGYVDAPFTSFVVVNFTQDVPEVGAVAGQRRSVIHTAYAFDHPGMDTGGAYSLELDVNADQQAAIGLSRVALDNGAITVANAAVGGQAFSASASCTSNVIFSSPEDFLQSILDATNGQGG